MLGEVFWLGPRDHIAAPRTTFTFWPPDRIPNLARDLLGDAELGIDSGLVWDARFESRPKPARCSSTFQADTPKNSEIFSTLSFALLHAPAAASAAVRRGRVQLPASHPGRAFVLPHDAKIR